MRLILESGSERYSTGLQFEVRSNQNMLRKIKV